MSKSRKKNEPVAADKLLPGKAPVSKKTTPSFWRFLKDRPNKTDLWIFLISSIACAILLNYCYPFPDSYSDTNAYIANAMNEIVGNYRPIGYSRFLRIIGNFSKSPGFLVFAQTILYFLSVAIVYFTVLFFFRPYNTIVRRIFLFFMIAAPSTIYLANMVLSDAYFTTLTNLWVATLLWTVMSRNKWMLLAHSVLLLLLFQTRYIALFYPAISFLCFIFAFYRQKLFLALCLGITTAIFFLFMSNTRKSTGEDVGVEIFSGFSGWQTANNALHIIPYCDTSSADIEDPQIRATHTFIVSHFAPAQYPQKGQVYANYIWDNNGPLKQYLMSRASNSGNYLYEWHMTSIELDEWGKYMIKTHPGLYIKHYILPNLFALFRLNPEVLNGYTEPSDFIKKWFNCEDCKTGARYDLYHQLFSKWAPAAMALLWGILIAAGLAFLVFLKRWKEVPAEKKMTMALLSFIALYIIMSVYASPVVLRYFLCLRLTMVAVIFIIVNQFIRSKNKQVGN